VIGTLQLLVLGVIGEYLGQVLKEARRRPAWHVAEASETAAEASAAAADDDSADRSIAA